MIASISELSSLDYLVIAHVLLDVICVGLLGGSMSSAVVNGLAGAGGGIIAQIITYPLQTVPLSPSSLFPINIILPFYFGKHSR